ncbi:MAG TPA: hypothetical protein DCY94_02835, partial [Firmicutes bacterium]|nr:hypothetical protein [Bacillota bacterium]
VQFTNISVTSQGEYKIDSSNLQIYYTWLQKALKGPSRYAKEGESTYYIAYDSWCSIDQKTNKVRYCREAATGNAFNVAAGVNPGPGEPWMNGGNFNLSEAVAATTVTDRGQSIRASKRSNNKGYQFNLERGFDAHTGGRPAMMGGTTRTVSSRFTDQEGAKQVSYHPMAYKITFCESEPGDCDDDVNQAVCPSGDTPAGAVFHENDDLKTCTIPKENSSGFTALEKEDTSTPHKADGYCEVACKEDLDIDLPGHKETAAGQYFKLDNYIPKIKAKRTCVTTSVDYKHFDDDLKAYEKQLIEYYNIWQDYLEYYNVLLKVEPYDVQDSNDDCCGGNGSTPCTPKHFEWTRKDWDSPALTPTNSAQTGLSWSADHGNEGGTCWEDCDGTEACDTELSSLREEYRIKTHNAYAMYHNTYIDYMETINAYNKCFNWTDSTKNVYMNGGGDPFGEGPEIVPYDFDDYYTYMYKFKPTVSFYYPDRDGAVFPVAYTYDYTNGIDVVGNGFGLGGMPDTKTNYWNKDSGEIDKHYESGGTSKGGAGNRHIGENQEDRKLIQCEGKTCSTASISVDSKFYTSKYLRRDEEVEYEYHLPRVYTKVPSGIVSTEDRLANNATWLKLDAEAVPVNINTEAGTYDYNITIRDIVNAADQDIRAETKGKNPDDNFQERFNGATGNGALNDGENYVCDYDVINDAYIPDPSKYNFFYRTIDPYDINPVKRPLGYNWNDERGRYIQDKMAEAEDDYQILTSREKFVFTLTPSLMKAVRDYNKTKSNNSDGGYADWDMVCKDYGEGGYHCYSNFLSCMASGGTMPEAGTGLSCSLFGDSLNDYLSDYSDYDWSDLDENRRALIQKQNEIDWSLGHAKNVSE